MIQELDVVRLKIDIENTAMKSGMWGTVVLVHASDEPTYEVEFCDKQGQTIGTAALSEHQIDSMPEKLAA
jgi:hypothetical protein